MLLDQKRKNACQRGGLAGTGAAGDQHAPVFQRGNRRRALIALPVFTACRGREQRLTARPTGRSLIGAATGRADASIPCRWPPYGHGT